MAKTIAAIATPHGVGGIGVVRLSGDRAVEIAQAVFRAADGSRLADLPGYTARFGAWHRAKKPLIRRWRWCFVRPAPTQVRMWWS